MVEVVILSVKPHESALNWDASELLSYGSGKAGVHPTGLLEVQFNDISTAHRITHYDVIATPSDDPGTSANLGVKEVETRVDRPAAVGSVVTSTLDLEPGTNYDIDVVAFYYSVQISPKQSNQDSLGATTFLSPPFLGGGVALQAMDLHETEAPSDRGVHYLTYKNDGELHSLRWLNPETFGPFDHKWNVGDGTGADDEGADILCTNHDNGDLEDDCAHDDGVGITHYRVSIVDEDGDTEYLQPIKIHSKPTYSAEFNLNDGVYTFAVEAGYLDGTKFYALSDKAQVEFDIPSDYRKYNQDLEEVEALLNDIVDSVYDQGDDFDAFYDSVWDYTGYSGDGLDAELTLEVVPALVIDADNPDVNNQDDIDDANAANEVVRRHALTIFLNNLYN